MDIPFNFRQFVEEKYKGKLVLGPYQNTAEVQTILDLRFPDLDIEDQRLAIQSGWALGIGNAPSMEESTEFRGYLWRPKQREIWWRPETYVAFMGAFGSSKTTLLCLRAFYLSTRYPGTRGLIMRETYPQLQKTTIQTLLNILNYFGFREGREYDHHISNKIIKIHNRNGSSSEILYMPAKEEGQSIESVIQDLQSLDLDWGGIDEPANIPLPIYLAFQYRIGRWGVITNDHHRQLWLVGNPPDDDHWIPLYFIEKKDKEGKALINPDDYYLVSAATYENKIGRAS